VEFFSDCARLLQELCVGQMRHHQHDYLLRQEGVSQTHIQAHITRGSDKCDFTMSHIPVLMHIPEHIANVYRLTAAGDIRERTYTLHTHYEKKDFDRTKEQSGEVTTCLATLR